MLNIQYSKTIEALEGIDVAKHSICGEFDGFFLEHTVWNKNQLDTKNSHILKGIIYIWRLPDGELLKPGSSGRSRHEG